MSPELLARTMVAVDQATGRRATRADGMALVLRALPLGLLWSAPLRVPGLRQLANLVYDAFSRRRRTISVWLGLAACAIPTRRAPAVAPAEGAAAEPLPEEGADGPVYVPEISAESRTPARAWLGRAAWILREGTVLAMLIVLVNETLFINQAVPKPLRFDEPGWVKRLVAYPRLIQAWSMFASDAPMSDMSMVVDATTADGRHVDPYSETSGRYANPGLSGIPPRLDNNSFFFNYSQRLPEQGVVQPGLHRVDPAVSGAHRARSGPHRSFRRLHRRAGQPAARRDDPPQRPHAQVLVISVTRPDDQTGALTSRLSGRGHLKMT